MTARTPLLLLALVVALAARAGAVELVQQTVTSYDMNNGGSGTFSYWDDLYDGSGNPAADDSYLSGGLGMLTDGVANTAHDWRDYVIWELGERNVTFRFSDAGGSADVDEIRIHVVDEGDTGPPAFLTISWDGPSPGSVDVNVPSRDTEPLIITAGLTNRWIQLGRTSLGIRGASYVAVSWTTDALYGFGWGASEFQFFAHEASPGQLLPVSYAAENGVMGSFNYLDDSYQGGTGSATTESDPLAGGLGDLADGLIAIDEVQFTEFDTRSDGPGPFVSWRDETERPITYSFGGVRAITSVRVYGSMCQVCSDVDSPSAVAVSCSGCTPSSQSFSQQSGTYVLELTGLGIESDELTVTLSKTEGRHIFITEIEVYGPPCTAVEAPTLSSSGIEGGDLALNFETPAGALAQTWAFRGDPGEACSVSGWTATADSCNSLHEFRADLATTLEGCNFEQLPAGTAPADFALFEAVLETTVVRNATAVFGDEQNRTDVTSFRVRVAFPKEAAVNASATVFGPAIDFSQVTTQVVDTTTREFTFTLATSVQWPYYLVENGAAGATGGAFEDASVATTAGSGGECDGAGEGEGEACTQRFELKARTASDECSVDTTVRQNFTIACRAAFTGSCDLPAPGTTFATFDVVTANLCPEVVEVASITPALTTYSDSDRTSVSTNYILETTLFARVTADVEAGLQAKRTTLTGLDIVSSCTGCGDDTVQPFTDGLSAAATDYNFQYASGGTDNSATGEVETDFSFTLNTNSLSFDNDATTGEAQITLTAFVSVEYDTPSAQGLERSYRVQAVSGPGSIGSSASANFGVSSAPAGGTTGGSSSTAGSTVLGVSAGTAALAGVGLAAVAAVAVGAAVAARRRRTAPARKLKHTSSSVELNDTAAIQA